MCSKCMKAHLRFILMPVIRVKLTDHFLKLDSVLETHKRAFGQWWYNFEGTNQIIFFDYYHLILFFDPVAHAVEVETQKLIEKAKIEQAQKSSEI